MIPNLQAFLLFWVTGLSLWPGHSHQAVQEVGKAYIFPFLLVHALLASLFLGLCHGGRGWASLTKKGTRFCTTQNQCFGHLGNSKTWVPSTSVSFDKLFSLSSQIHYYAHPVRFFFLISKLYWCVSQYHLSKTTYIDWKHKFKSQLCYKLIIELLTYSLNCVNLSFLIIK